MGTGTGREGDGRGLLFQKRLERQPIGGHGGKSRREQGKETTGRRGGRKRCAQIGTDFKHRK